MQPTFRQVPPREPRFSIQATCGHVSVVCVPVCNCPAHLEAGLSSLDSCDISRNTAADNDQVLLLCPAVSACPQLSPCISTERGVPASVA
jgi:hypothetical protein